MYDGINKKCLLLLDKVEDKLGLSGVGGALTRNGIVDLLAGDGIPKLSL